MVAQKFDVYKCAKSRWYISQKYCELGLKQALGTNINQLIFAFEPVDVNQFLERRKQKIVSMEKAGYTFIGVAHFDEKHRYLKGNYNQRQLDALN